MKEETIKENYKGFGTFILCIILIIIGSIGGLAYLISLLF